MVSKLRFLLYIVLRLHADTVVEGGKTSEDSATTSHEFNQYMEGYFECRDEYSNTHILHISQAEGKPVQAHL